MSAPASARPRAVLAMAPALAPAVFTDDQWARLTRLVDISDPEPLARFDEARAAALLAGAEIIIGHWGCPALDGPALDLAPKLRLFVYGAGSVKERGTVTAEVFRRGITVTSAAAANAVPVAEYTLAVILLANKGVFVSREWMRAPGAVSVRRPRPLGNYGPPVGRVGHAAAGRPGRSGR